MVIKVINWWLGLKVFKVIKEVVILVIEVVGKGILFWWFVNKVLFDCI